MFVCATLLLAAALQVSMEVLTAVVAFKDEWLKDHITPRTLQRLRLEQELAAAAVAQAADTSSPALHMAAAADATGPRMRASAGEVIGSFNSKHIHGSKQPAASAPPQLQHVADVVSPAGVDPVAAARGPAPSNACTDSNSERYQQFYQQLHQEHQQQRPQQQREQEQCGGTGRTLAAHQSSSRRSATASPVSRTSSHTSSLADSPVAKAIEQRRKRIQELQTKLHQQSCAVLQQKMPASSSSSSSSCGFTRQPEGSASQPQKIASRSSYGQLPTSSRRDSQSHVLSGSLIAVGPPRHSTSTSGLRRISNSSTGSAQRGVTPQHGRQDKTSLLTYRRDLLNAPRALSSELDRSQQDASADGCDAPPARESAAVGDPSLARTIAALMKS